MTFKNQRAFIVEFLMRAEDTRQAALVIIDDL